MIGLHLEEWPEAVQSRQMVVFAQRVKKWSETALVVLEQFRVSKKSIIARDFCSGFLSF